MNEDWPTRFVWKEPLPHPRGWTKPGVVMFFNLECPGCIARGIPFLKALAGEFGDRLHYLTVHTAYGHRRHPEDEVAEKVRDFAESYAKLPFPVALDPSGALAERLGVEGTPHWLVYAPGGALVRSIYGSQDNARTRLAYLMEELTQGT